MKKVALLGLILLTVLVVMVGTAGGKGLGADTRCSLKLG